MCWPNCQSNVIMKSHSDCMSSLALWFLEVTEGNSTSLLVKPSQECCFIAVWWINFTEGTSIVQESKMLLENSGSFPHCAEITEFISSTLGDKIWMPIKSSWCRDWLACYSAWQVSDVRAVPFDCGLQLPGWDKHRLSILLCASWKGKSILRHEHH